MVWLPNSDGLLARASSNLIIKQLLVPDSLTLPRRLGLALREKNHVLLLRPVITVSHLLAPSSVLAPSSKARSP